MVLGIRKENLAASIRAGNFEIISGVSPAKGGKDEGPDPHELLEAALAACTIITVQMYANRKEWKLDSTSVEIKIESESKAGTVIQRNVTFTGDLDDEQRQRLLAIADKCPIHILLEGKVEIKTAMV